MGSSSVSSIAKNKGAHLPDKFKATIAVAVSLALALSLFGAAPLTTKVAQAKTVATQALPEGTRTTKSTSLDYVVANFDGITEGDNVIETVTYQRLRVGVLDQVGKSIVLLGSVNNDTSKATFKYINQVAKEYGIQKVYWFDPFVGGSRGVDIIPNSDNPQKNQAAPIIAGKGTAKGLWDQLTANLHSNAKGSWLKYIDSTYTSADTHLLVYDKTATGVDNPTSVDNKLLVKDADVAAINADNGVAFKAAIAGIFTSAGLTKNQTLETTNFDDWDFFQTAFSENPTVESLGIDSREKFKIQTVTQPELVNILNVPGTHNVFMSGSWCGDSKQVIAYIAENAYKSNQPVYLYDFRLDGSASGIGDQAHTLRPETPTTEKVYWENGEIYNETQAGYGDSGIGFLGNELVELFYPFNSGTANYVQWYHPNGDLTAPLVKAVQRNFRSPFLIKYVKGDNNNKGSVATDWTHEYQDYEKPFAATNYAKYPIAAGFFADYETSSGPLNAVQKRAGFADLSTFFTGKDVVAHTAPGTISTAISADNGCGGSDDDPLDNSNDTTLLPYNGTDEYDVSNYNLNVGYYPAGGYLADGETVTSNDVFVGKAVITATAKTGLNEISLDFREAETDYNNISVTVDGSSKSITRKSRIDDYALDQHKLVLDLGSPIAKNKEFVVTIPYSVGTVDDTLAAGDYPNGFTARTDGKGFAALGEPLGSTYWFPNNNDPADGATYNITLSNPTTVSSSNWVGVSAGKRLTNTTSGSRRTSTWEITTPTSPYQVFAAFGAYTELSTNILLADGKQIPSLSFVNSTLYSANTSGARDKADYYYSHLAKYIQDLEAIVGPYPGTSVGFVLDDLGDGHGESAEFGAIETKWRPYYTNKNLNASESTFVHEFVHQWYGNSVLLGQWSDLWLNEAFATYITDLYYEKAGITASANTRYTNVYNNTAANAEWWSYPVAGVESELDLWGGAAAPYRKGGLALSVLRTAIGDDDFLQILKDWPAQNAGKATSTSDFIALAEGVSGADLANWSAAWLYGKVKPAALNLNGSNTTVDDGKQLSDDVSLKSATIAKIADQTYVNKDKKPAVTVKVDGKTVDKSKYDVAYKDNKKIGKATVTVSAKAGSGYIDSKDATFKIIPAKSKSVKAKAAKKSIKVTFAKHSAIDKVQVQYKLKSAKTWKTKTVSKATAKSYVIKSLKAGKTYQVRVGSYKKVGGATYKAVWSAAKTVKVKK